MKTVTSLISLICLLNLLLSCQETDPEPEPEACSNATTCDQSCLSAGIIAKTYTRTSTIRTITIRDATVISDTSYMRTETLSWAHVDTNEYRLNWSAICDFYQVHDLCNQAFWWQDRTCSMDFEWEYDVREKMQMQFNRGDSTLTVALAFRDTFGTPELDSNGNVAHQLFINRTLEMVAQAQ